MAFAPKMWEKNCRSYYSLVTSDNLINCKRESEAFQDGTLYNNLKCCWFAFTGYKIIAIAGSTQWRIFIFVEGVWLHRAGRVQGKAVRFWSCSLSRNLNMITPHRPNMPRWTQPWGKNLSQVALDPSTSRLRGRCSTSWASWATSCGNMWLVSGILPKCDHEVYSQ